MGNRTEQLAAHDDPDRMERIRYASALQGTTAGASSSMPPMREPSRSSTSTAARSCPVTTRPPARRLGRSAPSHP